MLSSSKSMCVGDWLIYQWLAQRVSQTTLPHPLHGKGGENGQTKRYVNGIGWMGGEKEDGLKQSQRDAFYGKKKPCQSGWPHRIISKCGGKFVSKAKIQKGLTA